MDSISCGSFLSSIWGLLFKTAHRGMNVVQTSVDGSISRYSELLRTEMVELRRARDDTVRKLVDGEAQRAVRRTDQIKEWVEKVDALDAAVAELPTPSDRNITVALPDLHDDLPPLDQLRDKLKDVRELKSYRSSITHWTEVQDVAEDAVSAVERILTDGGVGIIGIHGPPGSGKTALLRKVYESHQGLFPVVAFFTVSRQNSIWRLQEALMDRMGQFEMGERPSLGEGSKKTYPEILRRALSRKRFLLLLDDVWEKLDLRLIGIPMPNHRNQSKIVFTTSKLELCHAMRAREIMEMKRLSELQSWELFRMKVGADAVMDDPLIRPVAKEIVAHCGGLPLALITVGRAMADKRLRIEWEHALRKLEGMDKSLLSALKFSYDSLKDDKMRSCLLYCSLFPGSRDIDKEQLIEYWIGEGLLDGDNCEVSLHVARNRGYSLIRCLLSAGLLESGSWGEEKSVKLPDAIRDMALSLTGAASDGKNMFLVRAGEELTGRIIPSNAWAKATRVSLMQNRIEGFGSEFPPSPRLLTLLMNDNYLMSLNCISQSIPHLSVLDVSGTSLCELPPSDP